MILARLRGNKKRVYDILNSTNEGRLVLNNITNDSNLIVSFGSTGTLIDYSNDLYALLGVLLDGTSEIIKYLSEINDHKLIADDYTKVMGDATDICVKTRDKIDVFFGDKITNDSITKFVNELNAVSLFDENKNSFSNLVGISVFKQIYTMMYNFVLVNNGITKGAKIKPKGGYVASTNIHGEKYEFIKPENTRTGGKSTQLLKWISTRWNWTLPICCIDKLIHCYSDYFNILPNVHKYLPVIKYLSVNLKCSAEAFLNCYDVGFIYKKKIILRTSKHIKNDGTGLYLSVRPTNRTYNFFNLRTKGENSDQKCWYKLLVNDNLIEMDKAEQDYNNDIKESSIRKML